MMEKAVQRQILAIIDTVQQGLPTATSAACHEFAEAMGVIKDLCRKNLSQKRDVYYNEVFSELILALKQVAKVKSPAERQSIITICLELLTQVRKELKKEAKKDIVFLPYKVSMWDSLESIWQAAYEDKEHCNTYVIAIPYADRNPDMTVAEWHCEKNLFPDYVPVLDWRTIDLKEMHPDIIFFHNPYDDFNVLTSVDSHYYSRNLKFCTDKLVYVPYFVVGDTIDEHFCQAPGIVNDDYVIVQSEEIKEQ